MSFKPIDFESGRVKDKQRQEIREIREAILTKAKSDYYDKERRKTEAKNRGEDTWMLPSVEAKLDGSHKSSKKKKKKKKHKKDKKKKRSSSSSESESEEEMWVEKCMEDKSLDSSSKSQTSSPSQDLENVDALKKQDNEDWLKMGSTFGTYSREEMREREGTSRKKAKEDEIKRKKEANEDGAKSRELNPYYKDGGTGLPQKKAGAAVSNIGVDAQWLKKALVRAQEQAKDRGVSLEEIAAQRWGSLEKFYQLLAEAEGKKDDNRKTIDSSRRYSPDRPAHTYKRHQERQRRRSRSHSYSSDDRHHHKRDIRNYRRESDRRDYHSSRRRSRSHSRSSSSSSNSSTTDDSRQNHKGRRVNLMMKPNDDKECSSKSYSRKSNRVSVWDEDRRKDSRSVGRWKKKSDKPSSPLSTSANKSTKHNHSTSHSSSSSSSSSSDSEDKMEDKSIPKENKKIDEEIHSTTTSAPTPVTTVPEPVSLLTDKQMNDLAAKLVKAELLGNETQIEKLKRKLEAARTARDSRGVVQNDKNTSIEDEVQNVVLTRTDNRGFVRPVSLEEDDMEARSRRKKKMKTHGQDGKRKQYFPDDEKYDLKKMFEREKATTAEEQNTLFEKAAVANTERLNDDFDVDDMFLSKAAMKEDSAKQQERDKQRAIKEHHSQQKSLESCKWCFDNKEMLKHLIVSLGSKCYISLPYHESLTPGHCLIVPVHHVTCTTQADEDLWSEINSFRKSLVQMFNDRDEDCVFFETAIKFRHFPHMVIHCVPLPRDVGDMAPIYFKKAIMECETEWSVNKKLVDLKNKDVRRAIPKGLPYFFVDFGMSPGYAHVIEDEHEFPSNFAQEIIGGVLDVEQNKWRKPRKENFDLQRKKVMQFSSWYKKYDPTL